MLDLLEHKNLLRMQQANRASYLFQPFNK